MIEPYVDAVNFLELLLAPCDGLHTKPLTDGHRPCQRCLAIARLEVHEQLTRRHLRTAIIACRMAQVHEQAREATTTSEGS